MAGDASACRSGGEDAAILPERRLSAPLRGG
jgi:hypothetical protein